MQHRTSVNRNLNRHWEIQPKMDSFTLQMFAEYMANIAEYVKLINEMYLKEQLKIHSFKKAARDTSIVIRKVMLQDGGYPFKACVEPRLQPPLLQAQTHTPPGGDTSQHPGPSARDGRGQKLFASVR